MGFGGTTDDHYYDQSRPAGGLSDLWYAADVLEPPMFFCLRRFGSVMKDALTTQFVILVCRFVFLGVRARRPTQPPPGIPFPETALFCTVIFEPPQ
jgi:hypothetical protein